MKAIIATGYGAPDMLQCAEIEKPTPKDNEILIRIHATSVGPSDVAFRKGEPFVVRLLFGFNKPKHEIPGGGPAGEVEAVGKDVTQFKVGDRVAGLSSTFGTHAEYVCLPEDEVIVKIPDDMTYEDAVSVVDLGITGLTFLRDVAKVQPGQKVLINGASGAVGAGAVQLAKHYGAEVTGVCSGKNVELVKSLGADHVIDYTKEDFTQTGETYDLIFDAVGKRSYMQCRRALTPQGMYLTTVPSLEIVPQMLWTSMIGGKKAKMATAGLMQSKENLNFLNDLYQSGELKPLIDRSYPLEQIAEAHAYVETERKRGTLIITV